MGVPAGKPGAPTPIRTPVAGGRAGAELRIVNERQFTGIARAAGDDVA